MIFSALYIYISAENALKPAKERNVNQKVSLVNENSKLVFEEIRPTGILF